MKDKINGELLYRCYRTGFTSHGAVQWCINCDQTKIFRQVEMLWFSVYQKKMSAITSLFFMMESYVSGCHAVHIEFHEMLRNHWHGFNLELGLNNTPTLSREIPTVADLGSLSVTYKLRPAGGVVWSGIIMIPQNAPEMSTRKYFVARLWA
jgi:hypothetical protein